MKTKSFAERFVLPTCTISALAFLLILFHGPAKPTGRTDLSVKDTNKGGSAEPAPLETGHQNPVSRPHNAVRVRAKHRKGSRESDYRWSRGEVGFVCLNVAQDLELAVDEDGTIRVGREVEGWNLSLRMEAAEPERMGGGGTVIEAQRGGESWEHVDNGPAGIEHAITVARRSPGAAGLRLDFAVETGLRAVPDDDGKGVGFINAESQEVVRYDKLLVVDAAGRTLPSRMDVAADAGMRPSLISLVVDDRDATYPVVVDPMITSSDLAELGVNSAPATGVPGTAVLGDTVFFLAIDGVHGAELWKSDGTAGGTALVKDIQPGAVSSSPLDLVSGGGYVFFTADDGQAGKELWRTDGTGAGTILLRDIMAGAAGSFTRELVVAGGTCYFVANNSVTGAELWKSDGTQAGTVMVKDIAPGINGSRAEELAAVGDLVFFSADDGTGSGEELWKSDGTVPGTVMVKDIWDGEESSGPTDLFDFNGILYFAAETQAEGIELHRSDGAAAGTMLVKNLNPGRRDSDPESFAVAGGTLFFSAYDDTFDQRLWKTDGTPGGTVPVKDVEPEGMMMEFGGLLYFEGDDGSTSASELWRSDGTEAGTVIFKEIDPEPFASGRVSLRGKQGGRLLFSAGDRSTGDELWGTDGTTGGTALIIEINPGARGSTIRSFTPLGQRAFFTADDGAVGSEPWTTDGTAAGTSLLTDINVSPAFGVSLTVVDGQAYFAASKPETGLELWKTDGTPGGTSLVADIFPGPGSSNLSGITESGGEIYFAARDGVHGTELWRHVPGTGATTMVADINPGGGAAFTGGGSAASGGFSFVAKAGSLRYFVADNGTTGLELWRTDGTPGGTFLLEDTWPGSGSSRPQFPLVVANILYFVAESPTEGAELRRTDGTVAGTRVVKDVFPGAVGAATFPTEMDGTIFFSSLGQGTGQELWRTDGTEGGTVMVKDISPGSGSSFPVVLTPLNGILYFIADDGTRGRELWKSDGTAAGTDIVRDIRIPGSPDIRALTRTDNRLIFAANDGTTGLEPWGSDGTAEGTLRLADINPAGNSFSIIGTFQVQGTEAFFLADTGSGSRIWKTDGTPGGTAAVFPSSSADILGISTYVAGSYVYALHLDAGGAFELLGGSHNPPGTLEPVAGPGIGLRGTAFTALGQRLLYIGVAAGLDGRARTVLRIADPEGVVSAQFGAKLDITLNAAETGVELRFGNDITVPYVLEKGTDLEGWLVIGTYTGDALGSEQLVTEPVSTTPPGRMFFRLRATGN